MARARRGVVLPWRRRQRGWCGCRFGITRAYCTGLVAVERETVAFRGRIARRGARGCRALGSFVARCRRNTGSRLQRDVLQLPNDGPKTKHDHAGAGRNHTGDDQGIAEAEFLDRNSKSDPQETSQQNANPGDQHHKHHRNHPPASPKRLAAAKCYDTVILRVPPTSNCRRRLRQHSTPCEEYSPNPVSMWNAKPNGNLYPVGIVAAHQGGITPQFRITWKWNCAISGKRGPKAPTLGHRGRRVTIAMSSI